MILHVPTGGGPTVLVSVPRDSYVPIPGHGRNKINAAYSIGGPQLLVRTVESVTALHVDDYVETGLGGYANLVDAIGGVRICAKRAMNDPNAHLNLPAGCQQMDGATALGYARARNSDPRGDLGRVERQREVLAAIAGKTLSPAVLAVPWRSIPAARAGGGALTVDDGTSPIAIARFVLAMRAVSGGNLSLTVPIGDPNLAAGATPSSGTAPRRCNCSMRSRPTTPRRSARWPSSRPPAPADRHLAPGTRPCPAAPVLTGAALLAECRLKPFTSGSGAALGEQTGRG